MRRRPRHCAHRRARAALVFRLHAEMHHVAAELVPLDAGVESVILESVVAVRIRRRAVPRGVHASAVASDNVMPKCR